MVHSGKRIIAISGFGPLFTFRESTGFTIPPCQVTEMLDRTGQFPAVISQSLTELAFRCIRSWGRPGRLLG